MLLLLLPSICIAHLKLVLFPLQPTSCCSTLPFALPAHLSGRWAASKACAGRQLAPRLFQQVWHNWLLLFWHEELDWQKKKKCHYSTECPLWGCLLALKMLFCMGSESMPSTPHSKPLGVRVSLWINPLQPRKSFLPFITSTGVELNTIYTFSLPLSFMMHSPILIAPHRSSSNFCLWPRELYWIGISRSVSNTEQHTNCMITFSVSHWTESILITWKTLQWTVLDLRNL